MRHLLAAALCILTTLACVADAHAQSMPSEGTIRQTVATHHRVAPSAVKGTEVRAVSGAGDLVGVSVAWFEQEGYSRASVFSWFRCESGLCWQSHPTLGLATRVWIAGAVDLRSKKALTVDPAQRSDSAPLRLGRAAAPAIVVVVEREDDARRSHTAHVLAIRPKGALVSTLERTTYERHARRDTPKGPSGGGGHETHRMVFQYLEGKTRLEIVEQDFLSARRARCMRPKPVTRVFTLAEGRFVELDGLGRRGGCR